MIQIVESFWKEVNDEIKKFTSEIDPNKIPEELFDEINQEFVSKSINYIYSGAYVNFIESNEVGIIKETQNKWIENITEELSLIEGSTVQNYLSRLFQVTQDFSENILNNCIIYFLKNVIELSIFQYTIIHRNFNFITSPDK
jgi:hypothetical protein